MESDFSINAYANLSVTVVGLGLIGGSFAMALRDLGFKNLWGIDINEATVLEAENMGIIDKGYTEAKYPLEKSDIVIISLYPEQTVEFVKENIDNFKPGAIITDTAGIKEDIVKKLSSFLPNNVDFIGGHPMAGREGSGLGQASKDIFYGASYIFTPTENNKDINIKVLECIAYLLGCKNVVKMDPKDHDEVIAYTSHLPHILAVSLINSDIFNEDTSLFAAGAFKDATRVADINESLWVELINSNRENVIKNIEIFESKIQEIKHAIAKNDTDLLKHEFKKASLRRREIV
jgi:prephenate dehydrogenase